MILDRIQMQHDCKTKQKAGSKIFRACSMVYGEEEASSNGSLKPGLASSSQQFLFRVEDSCSCIANYNIP